MKSMSSWFLVPRTLWQVRQNGATTFVYRPGLVFQPAGTYVSKNVAIGIPGPPYHDLIISAAVPCHSFGPAATRQLSSAPAGAPTKGYVHRIHWLKIFRVAS